MADLRLTTRDPRTSVVRFKIPPGRVPPNSGLEQLVQQFAFLVLKPVGSDKFAPQLGGGLREMIGSVDEDPARGIAMNSVILAQAQMKTAQLNAKNRRTLDESLRNANLVSVNFVEGVNLAASVVTECFSAGAAVGGASNLLVTG